MSNLATIPQLDLKAIEAALIYGDTSKLTIDQKLAHYKSVCESVGLNHLMKPFEYMKFQGKEIMYSNKGCAEQLRNIQQISIRITDKQKIDDIYVVTAEGSKPDGRVDSSTGAVNIAGLKGEALANAFMKAETKAKRRLTLSICGLNMLDETEVETLKEAQPTIEQAPKQTTKPIQITPVQNVPFDIAAENAEFNPSEYVVRFGRWTGKTLSELDVFELDSYVTYIKKSTAAKGDPIRPGTQEFLTAAENFLSSREFIRI
jgi:hypothetical protein